MEEIWAANPDVKVMYCFEDGNCFIKHGDALSYKKDTQKEFKTVERPTAEVKEEKPTKKTK